MTRGFRKATNKLLTKFGLKLVEFGKYPEERNKYLELVEDVYRVYQGHFLETLGDPTPALIERLAALWGTPLGEALYLLAHLNQCLRLEGDVCEFGVAQGHTSALLAEFIRPTEKNLWLYDTFTGLPEPGAKDILKDDIFQLGSMEAYTGTMKAPQSMVRETLAEIGFPSKRTRIVPGRIEQTILEGQVPEKVCFAYVDFDFYEPISVALDFLGRALVPGGIAIVDDYDFFSEGAKTAVQEFLAHREDCFSFSLPIGEAGHFCILQKLLNE